MSPPRKPTEAEYDAAEELAGRVMGKGMSGLRSDDWPILVLAIECYVEKLREARFPPRRTLGFGGGS